ncbi:hypothetical protein Tco_1116651, partial [Tanacetum coccineum]
TLVSNVMERFRYIDVVESTIEDAMIKEQRLKDVLGPFQKYFEGLVNEESLDASEGAEISYAANKVKDVAGDTAVASV